MRFVPEKQKDLEKLKELLDNFHVSYQVVERLVVEAITLCAFHMPAMNLERLQESFAAITTMQLAFGDKENDVDMIQVLGMQIIDLLEKESSDIATIQGQAEACRVRFQMVRELLEKRRGELELHLEQLTVLFENMEALEVWFIAMFETIQNLEPISTEPEKIKEQLAEAESFYDRVQVL